MKVKLNKNSTPVSITHTEDFDIFSELIYYQPYNDLIGWYCHLSYFKHIYVNMCVSSISINYHVITCLCFIVRSD